eukprot:scaffold225253_cov42-Prasinocladus_malaysianus.AAC.1
MAFVKDVSLRLSHAVNLLLVSFHHIRRGHIEIKKGEDNVPSERVNLEGGEQEMHGGDGQGRRAHLTRQQSPPAGSCGAHGRLAPGQKNNNQNN